MDEGMRVRLSQAVGKGDHARLQRDSPCMLQTCIQQCRAQLSALHALVTGLAVRKLLVLGCGRVPEVGCCVRESRLLTDQQNERQQQMHDGPTSVHEIWLSAALPRRTPSADRK